MNIFFVSTSLLMLQHVAVGGDLISRIRSSISVTSSSVATHNVPTTSWTASNIIDGNTGNPDTCSCCAGTGREYQPWLQINLGKQYSVSNVTIIGNKEQFNNIVVYAGNTNMTQRNQDVVMSGNPNNGSFTFCKHFSPPIRFQYLLIKKLDTENLTICEVYMTESDLNLISNLRDIATTSQSSVFLNSSNYELSGSYTSEKAVDGEENYNLDNCSCCSVTQELQQSDNQYTSWWQIHLRNKYLVGAVEVFGRQSGETEQFAGAFIFGSNRTIGNNIPAFPLAQVPKPLTHFQPQRAFEVLDMAVIVQFVEVVLHHDILSLCEIRLYSKVCAVGYFGTGCSLRCHCMDGKACDAVTGECQTHGCLLEWQGPACNEDANIVRMLSNVTVTQSNRWSSCYANRSIDGLDTPAGTTDTALCATCSVARPSGSQRAFWRLDLGQRVLLKKIRIFGRPVGQYQSQNLNLYVSSSDLSEKQNIPLLSSSGYIFNVNLQPPRLVRSLEINKATLMTLCEVKLYGDIDFNIIATLRSIAITSQSGGQQNASFNSLKAIDGKKDYDVENCGCCSVASGPTLNWWQVDLTKKFLIGSLNIYGRYSGNTEQLQGSLVYASNGTMNGDFSSAKHIATVSSPLNTSPQKFFMKLASPVIAQVFAVALQNSVLSICEFQLFAEECDIGHFGEGCSRRCHCLDRMVCDSVNGTCSATGCLPGWEGSSCEKVCSHGKFGSSCISTCNCADDTDCNKTTGECPAGCAPGWQGHICGQPCLHGKFGDKCNGTCHCKNNGSCNITNGHCPAGCSSGWQGDACDTACNPGSFGEDCSKVCHCKLNTTCGNFDGHCSTGCAPGWLGDACNSSCSHGKFGENCNSTCNCKGDSNCNNENGHCPAGCAFGWQGKACYNVCSAGKFGENCSGVCHCSNKVDCNKMNGSCPVDCAAGWKGQACDRACDKGHFGYGCNGTCHCKGGVDCNKATGHCLAQCAAGWQGDACNKECENNTFGDDCKGQCHCRNETFCNHVNGSCPRNLCGDRWTGDTCQLAVASADNSVSSSSTIAGGVSAGVLCIAVGAVVAIFLVRRKQRMEEKAESTSGFANLNRAIEAKEQRQQANARSSGAYSEGRNNKGFNAETNVYDAKGVYYEFGPPALGIKIYEMWDYIHEKTDNKSVKLWDEFKKLPSGLVHPCTTADLPDNRGKNRYREMYAYDHSRVILEHKNDKGTDYVNACYIDGYDQPRKFVASQGPTKSMVDDFWSMVWQLKSKKIVMLTNLIELGTTKCIRYWPEDDVVSYGTINVKVSKTDTELDYNIRYPEVWKEGESSRRILQFHFKSWPDKDVPDSTWCLVKFWRAVKTDEKTKTGPIIVHCSAGVGRTGTFIALDNLMHQAKDEGCVRPFQIVEILRRQRVNMVQTKEQYVFLHEVLADALLFGTHIVWSKQFEEVYVAMLQKEEGDNRTRMEVQYGLIQQSLKDNGTRNDESPEYSNVETAMSESDAYRPKIKKLGSNFVQELGAIFVPNYAGNNTFLVAMSPDKSTMDEFWSLVDDLNIKTVVMLTEKSSICYKASCELGAQSNSPSKFSVNKTEETIRQSYTERTFTFKVDKKDEENMSTVKQFEYTAWKDTYTVPGDTRSFIDFLEGILFWQPHVFETQPILVHCGNGCSRSGIVCVALNELQRIRVHGGYINIVESVKMMKQRNSQLIHNFEQYKFCYDFIRAYLKHTEVYQNA